MIDLSLNECIEFEKTAKYLKISEKFKISKLSYDISLNDRVAMSE